MARRSSARLLPAAAGAASAVRPAEPAAGRNDTLTRYLDSIEERGW